MKGCLLASEGGISCTWVGDAVRWRACELAGAELYDYIYLMYILIYSYVLFQLVYCGVAATCISYLEVSMGAYLTP